MAIDWEILKTQYLQGSLVIRLEGLVLNLRRIQVLACSGTDGGVGWHLVRESQFFY